MSLTDPKPKTSTNDDAAITVRLVRSFGARPLRRYIGYVGSD